MIVIPDVKEYAGGVSSITASDALVSEPGMIIINQVETALSLEDARDLAAGLQLAKNRLTVGSRWRNHHTHAIFVVEKIKGLSVIARNEVTAKIEKIHRSNMSSNFDLLE